jgi:Flp pilus assembly pilin Flp
MRSLTRFLNDEQGQDLIEYSLLIAFVSLAATSVMLTAGGTISGVWGSASAELNNAATSVS